MLNLSSLMILLTDIAEKQTRGDENYSFIFLPFNKNESLKMH
jgi:hypothetical protein